MGVLRIIGDLASIKIFDHTACLPRMQVYAPDLRPGILVNNDAYGTPVGQATADSV